MNENRAMSNISPPDASAGQDVKAEPGSAFTEKHPNLTLLESGQNPGDILRAAREKAGYSLSDISAQTKINERQLIAIESGDVGRLPPETFAKAFIKSYCKALKMDAAPVILSFGYSEVGAHAKAARAGHVDSSRAESLEPKMPSSSKRLSTLNFDRKTGKKSLSYGVMLAAVVVMAVFYIPVFMSNQTAENSSEEVIEPNEAPVALLGNEQQSVAPSAPDVLAAPGAASSATPMFPALQQPSNVVETPAAAPTVPVVTEPVASAAPAVGTGPADAVAGGSQGALRFNFQEQSWVTVRDASDKVLISQLNEAGSNLEVRGLAPFKLIVGNAKAVKVTSNGQAVDLSSATTGEVARITVR